MKKITAEQLYDLQYYSVLLLCGFGQPCPEDVREELHQLSDKYNVAHPRPGDALQNLLNKLRKRIIELNESNEEQEHARE